jgi:rRNA pseudouridine-1189 N-methylase Emg1 (Nep1/Mra1 family)
LEPKKDKVHRILLSALDESMKNILGKNAAQAVYYHLEKRYLLKLEDIVEKPQTFSKAIKEMFGETGAEAIETLLVKDLCTKFRIGGKRKETSKLVDCLDGLKITGIKR